MFFLQILQTSYNRMCFVSSKSAHYKMSCMSSSALICSFNTVLISHWLDTDFPLMYWHTALHCNKISWNKEKLGEQKRLNSLLVFTLIFSFSKFCQCPKRECPLGWKVKFQIKPLKWFLISRHQNKMFGVKLHWTGAQPGMILQHSVLHQASCVDAWKPKIILGVWLSTLVPTALLSGRWWWMGSVEGVPTLTITHRQSSPCTRLRVKLSNPSRGLRLKTLDAWFGVIILGWCWTKKMTSRFQSSHLQVSGQMETQIPFNLVNRWEESQSHVLWKPPRSEIDQTSFLGLLIRWH